MRPLYEAVSEKVLHSFSSARVIPKKMYLSFTATREFAAVNIKPGEIRLGMDLGASPFDDLIQKAKLNGPMPRISHMVILSDVLQMDQKIMDCLQASYDRSHKK